MPGQVAFYPGMTVRGALDYLASFRPNWNQALERELIGQLRLDEDKKVGALSRGQRMQLALAGARAASACRARRCSA